MAGIPACPIYLAEEGVELPATGTYYVLGANGLYLHNELKVGTAFTKMNGVPWLEPIPETIKLKLPKIPARIVAQALAFFRKVFQSYNSESGVVLYWNETTRVYRLYCPTQTVSHGSVDYLRRGSTEGDAQNVGEDYPKLEEGWNAVGTIHSHCDFSAFHSGTDEHDESSFDGIHLTFGHVNRDQISMAASVAIHNTRQKMDPTGCCEGVYVYGPRSETPQPKHRGIGFMNICEPQTFYDIVLTDEEAQQLVADMEVIDKEWMPKVSKQVFMGRGWQSGQSWFGNNDKRHIRFETGDGVID